MSIVPLYPGDTVDPQQGASPSLVTKHFLLSMFALMQAWGRAQQDELICGFPNCSSCFTEVESLFLLLHHIHSCCSVSSFTPTRAARCQPGFVAVDTRTFLKRDAPPPAVLSGFCSLCHRSWVLTASLLQEAR